MSESIRDWISDQTLFKEAIVAFHPEAGKEYYSQNLVTRLSMFKQQESTVNGRLFGYISLDFQLTSDWELPRDIIIEPSIVINHGVNDVSGQECVQSFISPVQLPEWVPAYGRQLFVQGLAAAVSFTTSRCVYVHGGTIESVTLDELVSLEDFIADNRGDNFANIENAKVVIKTARGDIWGRFCKFWPTERPEIFPRLTAQMDDAGEQFLNVELDNDLSFTSVLNTLPYNASTDEIMVLQIKDLRQMAAIHPVVRGRGAIVDIHRDVLGEWNNQLSDVISNLWQLPYKAGREKFDYKKCMQAIRMVQLAHHNYKEDFDLSFSMLVSAIESIAQIAIPAPEKHKLHNEWKEVTKDDPQLNALFQHYCNLQSNDKRLKERFAGFVFKYCPVEQWWNLYDGDILQHGFNSHWNSGAEFSREQNEFTPVHFTTSQLENIVKDTYKYRSNFVHRGESAPHKHPVLCSTQRFFELQCNHDEIKKLEKKLCKEDRGLKEDKNTYPYKWTCGRGEKRKGHSITEGELFSTKRCLINRDLMREIAIKSISSY
ncbi:hypothetical protein [Pseudoalteromonas sp. Of7M-16]|uniref:hypothetical protein n=1 Tax=Pseudoalteromonas sp. Of7M-16 TaxID=2917756 RepID=UPI001EF4A530|nr:hypothetical protein [Pseudoalteromonas sp. Of7M-16]MCG7551658.1 hypothetical protein [Pseudoalteromonas sp. Of7M-16]